HWLRSRRWQTRSPRVPVKRVAPSARRRLAPFLRKAAEERFHKVARLGQSSCTDYLSAEISHVRPVLGERALKRSFIRWLISECCCLQFTGRTFRGLLHNLSTNRCNPPPTIS